MGPTKVFRCQLSNPDSIRAKHGLTDTRNATHGSGNFVLIFNILINELVLILDNIHVLIHSNTYSNTLKLLNSAFKIIGNKLIKLFFVIVVDIIVQYLLVSKEKNV